MSRPDPFADFADHPRFGRRPRYTGLDVVDTPDGRVRCHWHSPLGVRIAHTAIAADTARQRQATVAVTHYFDARRACRRCARAFLFFAEEQKHWYEELGFPLEADCLECVACRKDEQRLRALRESYERLLAQAPRAHEQTLALVECALELVESGVFARKLLPKLGALLGDERGGDDARRRAALARLRALRDG